MARLIPKGCAVHSIFLKAKGAEVRFRCDDDRGQKEYRSRDESGAEVISNYPSRFVRGVRTIRLGSASIGGIGASVHAFAYCTKERGTIACKPTSAGSFGGYKRKRRRR